MNTVAREAETVDSNEARAARAGTRTARLALLIRAEYLEMPGLSLTRRQAQSRHLQVLGSDQQRKPRCARACTRRARLVAVDGLCLSCDGVHMPLLSGILLANRIKGVPSHRCAGATTARRQPCARP